MRRLSLSLMVFLCGVSVAQAQGKFEVAFSGVKFDQPLWVGQSPVASDDRMYVVEQDGRIQSFPNRADVSESDLKVVIDIRGDKVLREGNEEGLLGFAFHPRFHENQQVFLHYSANGPRRNVLSRWTMTESGEIDPKSEEVLFEVEQPWNNHNGGDIQFGPDGFLYVTLGDGGAGGDPKNAGQRLDTHLGKILRIDVDRTEGGKKYAVPADNPFVGRSDALPEIWAYGLRNVWRMSFDPDTGDLWGGDVGQNAFEEIDVIVKGGNYGWKVREGFAAYRGGPLATKPEDMIDPVIHYPHSEGISVTGGHVYRGQALPALRGWYIYGDFGSGKVWALQRRKSGAAENNELGRVPAVSSFGVDREGELYATSFDGRVYRLVP